MDQPYAEGARRAANRLKSLDEKLPDFVELTLRGEEPPRTYSLAITIALASLVVSVAKFAYDVWKDLKSKSPVPNPAEQVQTAVKLKVDASGGITPAQRDEVIAVVVAEIIRS
jgi:hypothetical protein